MEYYPSFVPEMALTVLQALHRILAGVLLGSALIALCVYIVLVGSEMLSHSGSKPKGAKLPQSARLWPKRLSFFPTPKCRFWPRQDV